jgi:hypothetical protein
MKMVGYDLNKQAARKVSQQSGLGAENASSSCTTASRATS